MTIKHRGTTKPVLGIVILNYQMWHRVGIGASMTHLVSPQPVKYGRKPIYKSDGHRRYARKMRGGMRLAAE